MQTTRVPPASAGFFLVLLLLALFFGAIKYGRVMHEAYIGSAKWNRVDAVIEANVISPGSCGKGEKYKAQVRYRYVVQGAGYAGERIWFGEPFCGSWRDAQDVGAQFPVGAHVTAYVDPAHPASAVLVRDALSDRTWAVLVPILIGIGGLPVVGLWLLLRKAPPREPPRPGPSGGF